MGGKDISAEMIFLFDCLDLARTFIFVVCVAMLVWSNTFRLRNVSVLNQRGTVIMGRLESFTLDILGENKNAQGCLTAAKYSDDNDGPCHSWQ